MTACEQAYINGFRQKCAEFGVDPEKMAQALPQKEYPRLPQPWGLQHSPVPGGTGYNRSINPPRALQFDPGKGRYADVTAKPQGYQPSGLKFNPPTGRYAPAQAKPQQLAGAGLPKQPSL